MSPAHDPPVSGGHESPIFHTTHWSVVLRASSPESLALGALDQLCQAYWYPLYAFVRRSGHNPDDARDLTQEFFARLIDKQWLADADPERGRFRTFLIAALKHFLANEWHRAHRQKRGGGREFVALDAASAEERFAMEPADLATPDALYDRRWALTVVTSTQERLRAEMTAAGQRDRFEDLEATLVGDRTGSIYRALAAKYGVEETAVKSMVWRMRRRFRELLRHEVAQTIGEAGEVDAELAHLIAILGG